MPKIVVNGKEYDNPDEMPPEIRQLWESFGSLLADTNNDGIPDIAARNAQVVQSSVFVVDGKVYQSLADAPPEARQRYEQAMARLDANRDGIPDIVQGGAFQSPQSPNPLSTTLPPPSTPQLVKEVGAGRHNGARLILALAVLLVIAALGVAVGLFLGPALMR